MDNDSKIYKDYRLLSGDLPSSVTTVRNPTNDFVVSAYSYVREPVDKK